nr:hypothetical protein Iba_chr06cCG17700 [Ipomoea batatas]
MEVAGDSSEASGIPLMEPRFDSIRGDFTTSSPFATGNEIFSSSSVAISILQDPPNTNPNRGKKTCIFKEFGILRKNPDTQIQNTGLEWKKTPGILQRRTLVEQIRAFSWTA